MKNFIKTFTKDESGQGMTEYAMIIALVAGIAVVAISPLGDKIAEVFTDIVATF